MKAYEDLDKQYIDGVWRNGREADTIEDINPYNNSVLLTIKCAGPDELNEAYEAAERAAPAWAALLPHERRDFLLKAAEILVQRKDEFARWIAQEAGGAHAKGEVEVMLAREVILEAATFPQRLHGYILPSNIPGKESRVYRKPLGVVGIISPWNFPVHLSMRSIAPALGCGNTIVVKPASQTPATGGTLLAKLFEEAGLPKGVFNVVVGKSSVIGDAFVTHPIPKLISFTGSTPVGKNIGRLAGENLKKVALELGGNNVFIVMEDADLDQAVAAGMMGKFMHQGQICMAINRFLVHEAVYDEFCGKLVARTKQLTVGDPLDRNTDIGPLIDDKQVKRIQEDVEASVAQGAKIECGGQAEGAVLYPMVLSNVRNDMPIAQNEIFGPVAALIPFKDEKEMLQLANELNFGLSGALHTRNVERGVHLAQQVETGMIHVNDQSVNDEPNAPFGGERESGMGRFGGQWVMDEMTRVQWVTVQHQPREYPI
ncbi:aldehyde dehydrogenase family protein [Hymenobacter arizonensis]|uniref:Aldehyde dehydrogenase (NAD+) n=1 Tax=Hymenobacter arizonensis TaxID=1227077 RepID=A0A1I5YBW8_HYMAR|nr:aldehyde dehydrogenase family protein [Hymenobacter arizonensis]SFQ41387.1 aldehyde dehydrogenase (NAD+) [Hymenobacter arizonensis]